MAGVEELVSTLGDLMGDYNAVKGKVGQRVGEGHWQGAGEAVQVDGFYGKTGVLSLLT